MDNWSHFLVRNRGPLSAREQLRLQESVVAVVGCGGLGGFVCEELVRLGVGELLLIDPDRFEESNCNRQLYASLQTLGRAKAEVAAERAEQVHSLCRATAVVADFRQQTGLLRDRADLVVDCLDNSPARRELGRFCSSAKIPLVHGAVKGWYGQVAVQLPGSGLLERFYPPGGRSRQEPPSVLACTVATVASLQAAEAVKLLLARHSPLRTSWLSVDLLRLDFLLVPAGEPGSLSGQAACDQQTQQRDQ
ncbi:MAG TPA: HesA/MoeB/ThiF family protein [Desulfobulbus sp.]|nr:HesA/MoeB/ThiF family protein [Desulfobulbus sp.]